MNNTTRRKFSDPLIGRYFHSFAIREDENGISKRPIQWQGAVLGSPTPGYYLVELYEWLMGQPNGQCLVKIEQMLDWQFYDTPESMQEFWQRTSRRDCE